MRVDVVTKEYPPEVYGGAGVHVAELVRALRAEITVRVHAFGAPRDEQDTFSYAAPAELSNSNPSITTLGVDLAIAQDVAGADLVHSHTWYANAAGHLAKLLHGIPHVVTAHSLEPLRPWKAEQLGGGYRVSGWIERVTYEAADAVVAVSHGMRADILRSYPQVDPSRVHVIYNGINTDEWTPRVDEEKLRTLGVDPSLPSVVFVGRITRQKGLPYLLRAARLLPAHTQIILCAGAPDTTEILAEVTELVNELRTHRDGVVWIDRHLSREDLCVLLTSATVFACPSIYEPLGIVNLEAMACGAPVVGSGTGGIPEVVLDETTGLIVPLEQEQDGTGTPLHPEKYVVDLAAALTRVIENPELARMLGTAGRERAVSDFSWHSIAEQTRGLYSELLQK
ncbi:glycogen synthase [Klugiella xanthotipulae]|uniref:D-inositol 3-phosphate glycosyltransferase n=1 Tax=Klugiella xanthotipulae TaxID=244735 RepID=A0A543HSR0_9MICO|nr:glycogen synthase [Klugiella xanthotipulae]TQM61371.1 glycogen synthase (ADP-glucose) [Klugiella xanthotipulae]